MHHLTSHPLSRRFLVCAFACAMACALGGLLGCSSANDEGGDQSADANAPQMTVTVEVDATSQEGGQKESVQVDVAEGASVMDALAASGFDYVMEEGDYGAYITSLVGVEAGSNSGWVFSVNGEPGLEAADAIELSEGDVVTWEVMVF